MEGPIVETSNSSSFEPKTSLDKKHQYDTNIISERNISAHYFLNMFFPFAEICVHLKDTLEIEFVLYTICELDINTLKPEADFNTEDQIHFWFQKIFDKLLDSVKIAADACLASVEETDTTKKLLGTFRKISAGKFKEYENDSLGLLLRVRYEDEDVKKFLEAGGETTYEDRRLWLRGKPVVELATVSYVFKKLMLLIISLYLGNNYEAIKLETEEAIDCLIRQN